MNIPTISMLLFLLYELARFFLDSRARESLFVIFNTFRHLPVLHRCINPLLQVRFDVIVTLQSGCFNVESQVLIGFLLANSWSSFQAFTHKTKRFHFLISIFNSIFAFNFFQG